MDNKTNAVETNQDQNDSVQKKIEEQPLSKVNNAGGQAQSQQITKGIDFLMDVPLKVSVEVGRTKMLIRDFLKMKEGGVIELDKMADEPLDLYVNSRLIARGEAVVVNEKFGLRLIDVVSTMERLEKLR
jgi:flagellar motor switch protein FliN